MKRIKLTDGYSVLVWDEYFRDLNKYKWYIGHGEYTDYAYRHHYVEGKRRKLRMKTSIFGIIQKDAV